MKGKGWNLFWFRSLTRAERARIILSDVRYESPFVQKITRIILEEPEIFDKQDQDFEF